MVKNLYIEKIGVRAKIASEQLSKLSLKKRNLVLKQFNIYLKKYSKKIIKENKKDLSNAKHIKKNMLERLS